MRPERMPDVAWVGILLILGLGRGGADGPPPEPAPAPPAVTSSRPAPPETDPPATRLHPWTLWVEPLGSGELTMECWPVYRGALDVNREPPETLALLPGIGPSTAAALVEHRRRHGPFTRPEDLLRVPGIGPVRLRALRPLLALEEP